MTCTPVGSNGAFTFATPVAFNGSYAVTVGTQPTGQVCTVSNASGSGVTTNVSTVQVNCLTKAQAAEQTVQSNATCTALTPFYWEIGDKNGALASGTGGTPIDGFTTAPSATTSLAIASGSKWLYSAFVLELRGAAGPDPVNDVPFLNFTSGYTNFGLPICPGTGGTIDDCLNSAVLNGGIPRGTLSPDNVGKFYYDGGHMQKHASNFGLGSYTGTDLGQAISAALGISVQFSDAQPAGSGITTASDYAVFLRKVLNGELQITRSLGTNAVCTWHDGYNPAACPVPGVHSPTDSTTLHWHYSLGHWVEDEDSNRAYSSAGAFGFYPWVSTDLSLYGVIARSEPGTAVQEGFRSALCGRAVRLAYQTGSPQ